LDGQAPLHLACQRSQKDIADFLITKGADIYAKEGKRLGMMPLHRAAACGHKEIVEVLLARDVYVDFQSKVLDTPFGCACGGGHVEVAKMLIDKGANTQAKNQCGNQQSGD